MLTGCWCILVVGFLHALYGLFVCLFVSYAELNERLIEQLVVGTQIAPEPRGKHTILAGRMKHHSIIGSIERNAAQ